MTPEQLTSKLRKTIPLCDFMQLRVKKLDQAEIIVNAPLTPNVNIHGTGFAGSLYSLAVVSGWGLLQNRLQLADTPFNLVVKTAQINYRRPVNGDIEIYAKLQDVLCDKEIKSRLENNKSLTIGLTVTIHAKGKSCAQLTAEYVAISAP